MVTSKDVAKYAGVSRATVSAVINKNKFVSKEVKRINIQKTMRIADKNVVKTYNESEE